MTVLLCAENLAPAHGGPTATVAALARHLSALQHAITVVSRRDAGVSATEALGSGIPVLVGARGLMSVGRYLRQSAPSAGLRVIHDNELWMPFHHKLAGLAHRHRVPRIVSPHGQLAPWALRHHGTRKHLAWRLYQRSDLEKAAAIHVTSEHEVEDVRRAGLTAPIALIPNGVEAPDDTPPRRHEPRVRTVLFLSRILPTKGLLNLVTAWAALKPQCWRVVVAGPDERGHGAVVRKAAMRAGVSGDFEFVGATYGHARDRLYAEADVFVLPTTGENFGMVIAEALAWGVPVITTRGAPWPELESERCGWWTENGPDPLARALREAVSISDGERWAMGERGRRLVLGRYSWRKVAGQMLELYEWALGRAPRPSFIL